MTSMLGVVELFELGGVNSLRRAAAAEHDGPRSPLLALRPSYTLAGIFRREQFVAGLGEHAPTSAPRCRRR